jgi:hypothetical protein
MAMRAHTPTELCHDPPARHPLVNTDLGPTLVSHVIHLPLNPQDATLEPTSDDGPCGQPARSPVDNPDARSAAAQSHHSHTDPPSPRAPNRWIRGGTEPWLRLASPACSDRHP